MSTVGKVTPPLIEAWQRFSKGDASQDDFKIILADLVDVTHATHGLEFAAFMGQQKSLADYPLYCALIEAKREIGHRIIGFLQFDESALIEIRRQGREAVERSWNS